MTDPRYKRRNDGQNQQGMARAPMIGEIGDRVVERDHHIEVWNGRHQPTGERSAPAQLAPEHGLPERRSERELG